MLKDKLVTKINWDVLGLEPEYEYSPQSLCNIVSSVSRQLSNLGNHDPKL